MNTHERCTYRPLLATVAVAPKNASRRLPSLHELDEDLQYSVASATDGLDMTLLTKTMVPPEMVSDPNLSLPASLSFQQHFGEGCSLRLIMYEECERSNPVNCTVEHDVMWSMLVILVPYYGKEM